MIPGAVEVTPQRVLVLLSSRATLAMKWSSSAVQPVAPPHQFCPPPCGQKGRAHQVLDELNAPPSSSRFCPTMKLIFAEHRNAQASPNSAGSPARPADSTEASERRLGRFLITPPSEDVIATPPPEKNPIFPMTLDLRWPAPIDEWGGGPTSSSEAGKR